MGLAALDNFCCVHKVLGDAPPFDEPGLVHIHHIRDLLLKARGQNLARDVDITVLEGDGSEATGRKHPLGLGEENHMGAVDTGEVHKFGDHGFITN